METNKLSGLNIPVDKDFKDKIKKRAKELGMITIASYVRFIIQKDLKENAGNK